MLDAGLILQKSRQAYALCQVYSDEGEVFLRGASCGLFQTSFRRADQYLDFGFEWTIGRQTGWKCRLVASQDRLIRFDVPPAMTRAPKEFFSAIQYLTGATFGAVHTIPRLLVPRIAGAELWPSAQDEIISSSPRSGVARLTYGDSSVDIDLASFKITRYTFTHELLTIYNPSAGA